MIRGIYSAITLTPDFSQGLRSRQKRRTVLTVFPSFQLKLPKYIPVVAASARGLGKAVAEGLAAGCIN